MASSVETIFTGGKKPDDDFDIIFQKTMGFLQELIPGINVRIEYSKGKEIFQGHEVIGYSHSKKHSSIQDPCVLISTGRGPFDSNGKWSREVTSKIDPEMKIFFGENFDQMYPVWLHTIIEDIECEWKSAISETSSPEIKMAIINQIPTHIIAHLIAHFYGLELCDGRKRHSRFQFTAHDQKDHNTLASTIVEILQNFDRLSKTSVENEHLSHGIIIAQNPKFKAKFPVEKFPGPFYSLKRTALLFDGINSALWISPRGEPIGWVSSDSLHTKNNPSKKSGFDYEEFQLMFKLSSKLHGISFLLKKDGSILVFINGKPFFIRRNGIWRGILWGSILETMLVRYKLIGSVIFNAALILSATNRGGILGIVDQLPKNIHKKDDVIGAREVTIKNYEENISNYPEWIFHHFLPETNIKKMSPSFLASLASIDGATLIDPNGQLLTYGAVVPSKSSGSEGARTAAARSLSKFGLIIKISEDGPITIFEKEKRLIEA